MWNVNLPNRQNFIVPFLFIYTVHFNNFLDDIVSWSSLREAKFKIAPTIPRRNNIGI